VNVTRAAGLANPVDPMAPVDPAELVGPAEALVASRIGPAGTSGENERRMDS